jgi:hypothetical protein
MEVSMVPVSCHCQVVVGAGAHQEPEGHTVPEEGLGGFTVVEVDFADPVVEVAFAGAAVAVALVVVVVAFGFVVGAAVGAFVAFALDLVSSELDAQAADQETVFPDSTTYVKE